jgi:hypothetical protein
MDSAHDQLHDELLDFTIIGASHMAHGLTDFSTWSKAMLAEEGSESLRPFLRMIFANSKRMLERTENILEVAPEQPHNIAAYAAENPAQMSRVRDVITDEVLRMQHRAFIWRLVLTIAAYVGVTFWLNSIRQTAAVWFVWALIVFQLFFFISIFVVCSLRARQCGYRHTWLLFIPLFLSRIDNWEVVVIPALAVVMTILSIRNRKVSPEHQDLLPPDFDEANSSPSGKANSMLETKPDQKFNELAKQVKRAVRNVVLLQQNATTSTAEPPSQAETYTMITEEYIADVKRRGYGGQGYLDLLLAIKWLQDHPGEKPQFVPASQVNIFARRIYEYAHERQPQTQTERKPNQ